eukprot:CAMPEP_0115834462 /NCGR_PEP_ID=MMETSP0287-20121206/3694_1 /TAXON_ID=412157 /ORGANISM="Chrysochromulina rotalis, Strain UIO044" /LENGTH=439 /DNA_ID=CAMNT_0003287895 /DNA_START=1 /DNA_END=1320 /DNA_ORIENTATION=-
MLNACTHDDDCAGVNNGCFVSPTSNDGTCACNYGFTGDGCHQPTATSALQIALNVEAILLQGYSLTYFIMIIASRGLKSGASRRAVSSFVLLLLLASGSTATILTQLLELIYVVSATINGVPSLGITKFDLTDMAGTFVAYATLELAFFCLILTWIDTVVSTMRVERLDAERLRWSRVLVIVIMVMLGIITVALTIVQATMRDMYVAALSILTVFLFGMISMLAGARGLLIRVHAMTAHVMHHEATVSLKTGSAGAASYGEMHDSDAITPDGADSLSDCTCCALMGAVECGHCWATLHKCCAPGLWVRVDPCTLRESLDHHTAGAWARVRTGHVTSRTSAAASSLSHILTLSFRLLILFALEIVLVTSIIILQWWYWNTSGAILVTMVLHPVLAYQIIDVAMYVVASRTLSKLCSQATCDLRGSANSMVSTEASQLLTQ